MEAVLLTVTLLSLTIAICPLESAASDSVNPRPRRMGIRMARMKSALTV